MLKLPVTLVIIDSVCHDLARLAVEDSTRHIEFADVIVFSDKKDAVPDGARWIPTYINSLIEYQSYLWYGVPFHITTPHFLVIQWDGFVVNPQGWTDEFLEYDYIGAPWVQDFIVGNGGFSLRSLKLAKHVATNPCVYKLTFPEDRALVRYHHRLMKLGYVIADKKLASRFSFENVINYNVKDHFGFHGIGNYPRIFNEQQLAEREAVFSDFVRKSEHFSIYEDNKRAMKERGDKLGCMRYDEQERT